MLIASIVSGLSDTHKVPAVVVLVGGEYKALESTCQTVEAKVAVLVVAGTGGAADFIAEAFNRNEQQSVTTLALWLFEQLTFFS